MAQVMMEILSDSLPPQDQRSLSFSSHQPKAFNEWATGLPIVNIGETAKILYSSIQELNHLKASASLRLQLLEMIRSPIHYTVDALKQHYAHQTILLSEKSRKIANLSQALQRHLAIGYKIVLIDALNGGFLGTSRENISTAIHRTLSELTFILLRCLQLYHPPLPKLWQEIHSLYALAEKRDALSFTVSDPEIDTHREHSIAALYKKAILIATCHPNQLQLEDLENVFFCSNNWPPLINISTELNTMSSSEGLFATDLNADSPPGYASDATPSANIRYIDLNPVIHQLRSLPAGDRKPRVLKAEHSAQDRAFLSEDLTRHLINTWSQSSKRLDTRITKATPAAVCLGLNACHHHILSNLESSKTTRQATDNMAQPTAEIIELKTVASRQLHLTSIEHKHEQYPCKVINTSAYGACLLWTQQLPLQLKNGELLLMRLADSPEWRLGTIRWTRHFQGEGVRTGIQLFASNAMPVRIQHRQKNTPHNQVPGLLLPPMDFNSNPTLITAKVGFKQGSQIVLLFNGEHTIQLKSLINHSVMFNEFEISCHENIFSPNDEPDTVEHAVTGHSATPHAATPATTKINSPSDDFDELDSLWQEL